MAEYLVDDQLRCHVDVVAGWAIGDEVVRVSTEVGVAKVVVEGVDRGLGGQPVWAVRVERG
jgi:hypothetical protein